MTFRRSISLINSYSPCESTRTVTNVNCCDSDRRQIRTHFNFKNVTRGTRNIISGQPNSCTGGTNFAVAPVGRTGSRSTVDIYCYFQILSVITMTITRSCSSNDHGLFTSVPPTTTRTGRAVAVFPRGL